MRKRPLLLSPVVPVIAALALMACDDSEASSPCGLHGERHGDHCHCDTGYLELDGLCVARPPADTNLTDTQVADTTPDDGGVNDTTSPAPDTTDSDDTGPDDMTDTTSPVPALSLDGATMSARALTGNDTRFWVFEAQALPTMMSLEIYPAYGGPDAPGTIDITAAETDYGTCVVPALSCRRAALPTTTTSTATRPLCPRSAAR